MSRERPANTKETAKHASPMPLKKSMKDTNAVNPMAHTHKGPANMSTKTQGGITFGQIRFDAKTHMLIADAKKGGNQIRCTISEDALCECFDAQPTSIELQSCFTEHKGELLKALERKWLAGEWATPNKEICLEEIDIRKCMKE